MLFANIMKCRKEVLMKLLITVIPSLFPVHADDLFACASTGNLACVKKLIKKGVQINSRDTAGRTALMLASENGHFDVIRYLVKKNADVDAKDRKGQSALMRAVDQNRKTAVDALIAAGANIDKRNNGGETALMSATIRGDCPHMEKLLVCGANIDAATPDNIPYISGTYAYLTNPADYCKTALMLAIEHGKDSAATLLIDRGADLDAQTKCGVSALMIAAAKNRTSIALYMIRRKANPDLRTNNGWTALMIAAKYGRRDIVMELLKLPIITEPRAKDGTTALTAALFSPFRDREVVIALLNSGADTSAIDRVRPTLEYSTTIRFCSACDGRGFIERDSVIFGESPVKKTWICQVCGGDSRKVMRVARESPDEAKERSIGKEFLREILSLQDSVRTSSR